MRKNIYKLFILALAFIMAIPCVGCDNEEGESKVLLTRMQFSQPLSPTPEIDGAVISIEADADAFGKDLWVYKKVNQKQDELAIIMEHFGFDENNYEQRSSCKIYKNESGAKISLYETGAFCMRPQKRVLIISTPLR